MGELSLIDRGHSTSDQAIRAVGVLTARVILGLIFGMAGYWNTFELTPFGHAEKLFIVPYANTWIPVWMLWTVGTVWLGGRREHSSAAE